MGLVCDLREKGRRSTTFYTQLPAGSLATAKQKGDDSLSSTKVILLYPVSRLVIQSFSSCPFSKDVLASKLDDHDTCVMQNSTTEVMATAAKTVMTTS